MTRYRLTIYREREREREIMEGLGFRSRTSTSTENIINPQINKEDPRHDSSIDFD